MKRATLLAWLALLLLAGAALAQGTLAIPWSVIGGGGGHAKAGAISLDGTLGQPVVGQIGNLPHALCAGYWCGAGAEYRIYLPLVLRNF